MYNKLHGFADHDNMNFFEETRHEQLSLPHVLICFLQLFAVCTKSLLVIVVVDRLLNYYS